MKKSILIGALAALMLFAFVACDNSTPVNKTIEGLEVTTSKTDYLVNQTFDPSTVSVLVRYTDGSTAPVNASLTVDGVTDGKLSSAKQYTVTATYGYVITDGYFGQSASQNQVTGTTTITAYEIDSIAVTKLPEVVSYEEGTTKDKIDLTGIEVTATYNGASKMVLAEGEYAVDTTQSAIPAYDDAEDAENTTNITVEEKLSSSSNKTTTFEVAVTEEADEVYELNGPVTNIRLSKGTDYPAKVFYGDNVSVVTNNIVVEVSDDGTNWAPITTGYRLTWGAGANTTFEVGGNDETTAAKVSLYVTYSADPTVSSTPLEVDVYNYVTSLVASPEKITGVTKGSAASANTSKVTSVSGVLAYDSNTTDDQAATTAVSKWNFENPLINSTSEVIVAKNAKGEIVRGTVTVEFAEN